MSPIRTYSPIARITTHDYQWICDVATANVTGVSLASAEDSGLWDAIEDESYRLLLDKIDRQGVDVKREFIHWRDPESLDDCFRNED